MAPRVMAVEGSRRADSTHRRGERWILRPYILRARLRSVVACTSQPPPVKLGDLPAHRAGGLQHVAHRPAQRQQHDAAGAARAGPERVLIRGAGAQRQSSLRYRGVNAVRRGNGTQHSSFTPAPGQAWCERWPPCPSATPFLSPTQPLSAVLCCDSLQRNQRQPHQARWRPTLPAAVLLLHRLHANPNTQYGRQAVR